MHESDLVRIKRDGNKVTLRLSNGKELVVWLPESGVTMEEMEQFINHLLKTAKESNN